MAFSKEWDDVYKNQKHLSVWPWTDIVSYYMRYVKPALEGRMPKILELGFGAGANIPFYKSINADFYGIEGSKTIVEKIKNEYKEYASNIICNDFTKEIPFSEKFDVIIDRASVTHNDTATIIKTISMVKDCLVKNGIYIGIDWFSTSHSEFNSKAEIIDKNTKVFTEGYFHGLGKVHFSDEKHIREVFKNFKIIKMEHKIHTDYTKEDDKQLNDNRVKIVAAWNFAAQLKD